MGKQRQGSKRGLSKSRKSPTTGENVNVNKRDLGQNLLKELLLHQGESC